MHKRMSALVIAVGVAAHPVFAADAASSERAKALVKAMRSDESVVAAVGLEAWARCKQSPADKDGQCDKLRAAFGQVIDRGRVSELLAPFFVEQLSSDEVEALIGFYDSDVGRQATSHTSRALNLGTGRPMPELDQASMGKFVVFQQTPAARKLAALAPKYAEAATRQVGPYLCTLLQSTGNPCASLTRLAVVAAAPAALLKEISSDPEEAYQRDADIVRARHLLEWAQVIEAYNKKSGRYPLQDRVKGDAILRVRIATREQQAFLDPAHAGYQGDVALDDPRYTPVSMKEFVADIEAVLGREIVERYDPQRVPTDAPNFFSYFATKDGYLIWSVCRTCPPQLRNVTIPMPPVRTFNIGSAWFIENVPRTQSLEGLQANKDFVQFVGSGPKRSGSFEGLARDQARESKR